MSYTFHLFAFDSTAFARRLLDRPDALLGEVRQRILENRQCDESDLAAMLEAGKRISTGDLPKLPCSSPQ
jgi:hypothetical protein